MLWQTERTLGQAEAREPPQAGGSYERSEEPKVRTRGVGQGCGRSEALGRSADRIQTNCYGRIPAIRLADARAERAGFHLHVRVRLALPHRGSPREGARASWNHASSLMRTR